MGQLGQRELAGASPPTLAAAREWIGWEVGDVHGAALGRLEDLLAGDDGARPRWLVINEFRFGDGRRFVVPADEAAAANGRVWVPYERSLIWASAQLAPARHTPQAERRLRAHYLLGDAA